MTQYSGWSGLNTLNKVTLGGAQADGFWCERRSKYSMDGHSFGDTNALIVKSAYLGDIA